MPTYIYIESYYKCIGKESTSSEQFFSDLERKKIILLDNIINVVEIHWISAIG